MAYPVETKVTVAGVASTLTGLVVAVLGTVVFRGAVPPFLADVLGAVVTGGVTYAAAWWAKHTPRPPTPPVRRP